MLAKTITVFVHGEEGYNKAIETTQKLFDAQNASVDSLSADDLENMEGVIKFEFPAEKIQAGIDIVSFLAETGSFPSKGEARKMIQSGGVSINRNKINEVAMQVNASLLLHEKYILIQKGKKSYYLVKTI